MSKPTHDGGPAFPSTVSRTHSEARYATLDGSCTFIDSVGGMSLRDWFAGQIIGHFARQALQQRWTPKECALDAYAFADAMLAAREQKEGER